MDSIRATVICRNRAIHWKIISLSSGHLPEAITNDIIDLGKFRENGRRSCQADWQSESKYRSKWFGEMMASCHPLTERDHAAMTSIAPSRMACQHDTSNDLAVSPLHQCGRCQREVVQHRRDEVEGTPILGYAAQEDHDPGRPR